MIHKRRGRCRYFHLLCWFLGLWGCSFRQIDLVGGLLGSIRVWMGLRDRRKIFCDAWVMWSSSQQYEHSHCAITISVMKDRVAGTYLRSLLCISPDYGLLSSVYPCPWPQPCPKDPVGDKKGLSVGDLASGTNVKLDGLLDGSVEGNVGATLEG